MCIGREMQRTDVFMTQNEIATGEHTLVYFDIYTQISAPELLV